MSIKIYGVLNIVMKLVINKTTSYATYNPDYRLIVVMQVLNF